MFFAIRPSEDRVAQVLSAVGDQPLTYSLRAPTRDPLVEAPAGFVLDRYGTQLGSGDEVYDRACKALRDYSHYPSSFTRVVISPRTPELAVGQVFGTLATHFGFASLHPCRVVFLVSQLAEGGPRRFGFAIGTLPGHFGSGEECFTISQERPGGAVRYEVQAISRPGGLLAQIGRPFLRLFQRRFQRETLAEMREHCGGDRLAEDRKHAADD